MKVHYKAIYFFDNKALKHLRYKMLENGFFTYTELARKLKVSRAYLSSVILGKKSVSIDFFDKLKLIGIDLGVEEKW